MPKFNPYIHLYEKYEIKHDTDADYYVIGDVHGCIDEYLDLCDLIKSESEKNGRKCVIIQLGDMIDRGPAFEGLILSDPSHYQIMGNHEFNFVNEHLGNMPCRSKARMVNHERLDQLPQDQKTRVFESLLYRSPFYYMVVGNTMHFFSHAPLKGVENLNVHDILYRAMNDFCMASFCMRALQVDYDTLAQRSSFSKVVFYHGHQSWEYKSINEQITEQSGNDIRAFNLDSGCVYGGNLVSVRINDLSVYSVDAKRAYVDKER